MMADKSILYKIVQNKILLYGVCAWVTIFMVCAPARAQSLKQSLVLAYETNPTLRAERASLRAQDEMTARARAHRRPSLSAVVNLTHSDGRYDPGSDITLTELTTHGGADLNPLLESLTGSASMTTQTVSLQAEQYLFRGLRTRHEIKESTSRVAAARAHLISAEQGVLLATIQAYLRAITARQTVDIAQNNFAVLRTQLDATTASFDVGTTTRTDIAQAKARLARVQATLIRATADKTRADLEFIRLVGQQPVDLENAPPLPDLPANLETVLDVSKRQNPLIARTRAREMASTFALKKAKGLLAPSIKATASVGYVENNFMDGDQRQNATLGAAFFVPLFQGGRNYAAIREAREVNMADRYRVRDTMRQVEIMARTAWSNLMTAKSERAAANAEVTASTLALEGVRLENRLGQRTIIDILNAEQDLLNAQLNQLKTTEKLYIASYQILQSMGTLTATGLALDTSTYDPAQNTRRASKTWIDLPSLSRN